MSRSAKFLRMDRTRNYEIRTRIDGEETMIQRVEMKGLKWYGHITRKVEERWPKRTYNWTPP
jgi:hypothetical protein